MSFYLTHKTTGAHSNRTYVRHNSCLLTSLKVHPPPNAFNGVWWVNFTFLIYVCYTDSEGTRLRMSEDSVWSGE